jgi:Transforming acidic coiled-coil-containing protein (TACC).
MNLKHIIHKDSISDIQEILNRENSIIEKLKQVQKEISEARDEEAEIIGLLQSGQGGELNRSKLDNKVEDLLIYIDDDIEAEEVSIQDNIKTIEKFREEVESYSNKHEDLEGVLEDCLKSIEEERKRLDKIASITMEEIEKDKKLNNQEILNKLSREASKIQPQRRAIVDEIDDANTLIGQIEDEEEAYGRS